MADTDTMSVMPAGREKSDMELLGYMMQDKLASNPNRSIQDSVRDMCREMADIRTVQLDTGETPTLDIHMPIMGKEKNGYIESNDLNLISDENGNISARIFKNDTLKYDLGGIIEGQSDFNFFPGQEDILNNEYEAIGSLNTAMTRDSLATALDKVANRLHNDPEANDINIPFNIVTGQIQNNTYLGNLKPAREDSAEISAKSQARAEYARLASEIDDKYQALISAPELTQEADGQYTPVTNTAFFAARGKDGQIHPLREEAIKTIEDTYLQSTDGNGALRDLISGNFSSRVMINYQFPDGHKELQTYDELQAKKYLFGGERDVVQEALDAATIRLAQRTANTLEQKAAEKDHLMDNANLRNGFTYKYDVYSNENPVTTADIYVNPARDPIVSASSVIAQARDIMSRPEVIKQMAANGCRIESEVTIQHADSTIKARLNNTDKELFNELKKKSIGQTLKMLFSKKEQIPKEDRPIVDEMKKTNLTNALTTRGQFVDSILLYMSRVNDQLPMEDKLLSMRVKANELALWDKERGVNGYDDKRKNLAAKIALERYENSLSKHRDIFVKETKELVKQLRDICQTNNNVFFVDMDYYKDNILTHSTAMFAPGDNVTLIENGKSMNIRSDEFIPMFASSLTAQRITETLEREIMASIEGQNSFSIENRAGARANAGIESMSLDETLSKAKNDIKLKDKIKSIENKQKDDGERT